MVMRARWLFLFLAVSVAWLPLLDSLAGAAMCNLTTAGSSCMIQGALFMQADPRPTGSGVINSFVRIQQNGTEQGYNTNGRSVPFDEKSDPIHTHSLLASAVPVVTIGGVQYREFGLDINEPTAGDKRFLSLDAIKIFLSPSGNLTTTDLTSPTPLGTLIYSLDSPTSNNWIKLNSSLGSGSGSGDMFAYIPNSLFVGPHPFLTLYSQFGLNYASGAGFEEWWVREGQNGGQAPVPEPASILLLGAGLVGMGTRYARRHRLSSIDDCSC